MRHTHGVDSEVGRLRAVLVHRPGAELKRITPRGGYRLLFPRLPWVERAQQEHDLLAQSLRDHGVEVLYVTELLQDVMEYGPARHDAIGSVLADPRLGERLRSDLRGHLEGLDPEELAGVLVAGLTAAEFRPGRGLVYGLLDRCDFVIDPLPNLVFTGDSSAWIGDAVAVASPADRLRRREPALVQVLYQHHPRFTGSTPVHGPGCEPVDGGDVLTLAPGVMAAGIGGQTTTAGVERLAGRLFRDGLARAVLAIPLTAGDAGTRLDTLCTVIDIDTVLMSPATAYTLRAHTVTPGTDGLRVSRAQPFLEAAARAIGIDQVTVIGTGLEPPAVPAHQWDDGCNALAIAPRVLLCHERNAGTNARLESAGIEVVTVAASELGSRRGGPRCMSRALRREPVATTAQARAQPEDQARWIARLRGAAPAADTAGDLAAAAHAALG